jgi:methionyl-tRNA synthetase
LEQNLIKPIAKIDKKEVVLRDTEHLFVEWGKIQKDIEKYLERVSPKWREWVRNEANRWIKEGLRGRAVTRDLDWGVEIPAEIAAKIKGSENKRVYVWFDAVIGYYSASVEWAAVNNKDWKDFWYGEDLLHYYFMGKDNLVFHTIFWPGQLMVYDENLHLPDLPAINQYLNLEGKKFSKSRGTVVDTGDFIDEFSADSLRFYLTTVMPENSDASFTWEDFYKKNNDLLVGHIGNYVYRGLNLYKEQNLNPTDLNDNVIEKVKIVFDESSKCLSESRFKDYYAQIELLAEFANKYFNEKEPWKSKKENQDKFIKDGADLIALGYAIMALMEPITPNASKKYFEMVGISENLIWQSEDFRVHLEEVVGKIKISNISHLFEKYEMS